MKDKTITIRLDPADIYYLEELQNMRSEHLKNTLNLVNPVESISDLIRRAILRFYNDTLDYFIYEDPNMFIKSNKMDS